MQYFLGFYFPESIFWGFFSVEKYFLGRSKYPALLILVCKIYEAHPLGFSEWALGELGWVDYDNLCFKSQKSQR